jgi:formylglycine-generating enzyme required for sulfatase activity
MHGNVWEWVQDCYAPYADNAVVMGDDGQAACANRVNRGGSWFSTPQSIRSAYRGWDVPNLRSISVGFRVARSLD